jgi:hypothetical protein
MNKATEYILSYNPEWEFFKYDFMLTDLKRILEHNYPELDFADRIYTAITGDYPRETKMYIFLFFATFSEQDIKDFLKG